MRVLVIGIALSIIYFLSNAVFAAGIGFVPCENLLKTKADTSVQPGPMDYFIADLEDFYLEFIQDTVELSQESAPDIKKIEVYLNKKAYLLNQLMRATSMLRGLNPSNYPEGANLDLLVSIFKSFGANPTDLGFEIKENGDVAFSGDIPPSYSQPMNTIGFMDFDEPRSIGFAPFTKKTEAKPRRQGGKIAVNFFELTEKYLIADGEKGKSFEVPAQFLLVMSAESEEKSISLIYDQDEGQWRLAFENHFNPDGKIGF